MERQKRYRPTSWPIGIRVYRRHFPPSGVLEKPPLWPNMLPLRPPSCHTPRRRRPSWCTSRHLRRIPVPIRTPRRIIPRRPTIRTKMRIPSPPTPTPIPTMLIILIRATIPLGSYGEACRLLVPSSTMGVQVVVNKIVMGVLVIALVGFRNTRRSVPGTRVVPRRNDPLSKFN